MKTIAKVLFGSKLYGTDGPESDTDYKEIYVPPARDILIGNVKNHMSRNTGNDGMKNTADDIDYELFSLRYFINMAIEGETVALDMIHAPADKVIHTDLPAVWKKLQDNRYRFYSTDMKSYLGYVRKQAGKYGVKGSRMAALREVMAVLDATPNERPNDQYVVGGTHSATMKTRVTHIAKQLPVNEFCEWQEIETKDKSGLQRFYVVLGRKFQNTISLEMMKSSLDVVWKDYGERARKAEQNDGIDFKALSHALRGGYQLQEIYKTGDLVYPLKDREYLRKVKDGSIHFKEIQEELEAVVSDVEILAEQARRNGMQKAPDKKFWDDFIEEVYLEHVMDAYNL